MDGQSGTTRNHTESYIYIYIYTESIYVMIRCILICASRFKDQGVTNALKKNRDKLSICCNYFGYIYSISPPIYIYIYINTYIHIYKYIYIFMTFSFRMLCLKKPYNMDFLKKFKTNLFTIFWYPTPHMEKTHYVHRGVPKL